MKFIMHLKRYLIPIRIILYCTRRSGPAYVYNPVARPQRAGGAQLQHAAHHGHQHGHRPARGAAGALAAGRARAPAAAPQRRARRQVSHGALPAHSNVISATVH